MKALKILLGFLMILIGGCGAISANGSNQGEELTPMLVQSSPISTATMTSAPALPTDTIQPTEEMFQPEMIFIPSGEFEMGAKPEIGFQICLETREGCALEDFEDESPVHSVFLEDYWIFKYEVTNAFYRICVEAGGCAPPAVSEFYNNPYYAEHPAVHVDWFAAAQFCKWAGGRLPTEAEWEKAALGETGWVYPWGDVADCDKANYSGCNFGEVTLPIGSYPAGASVYGVMDMAGNAAEWTADWYDPEFYVLSPEENPLGPDSGELKTARGGSWKNLAVGIRSTNRGGNFPEVFSSGVGFRCVVSVP